MIAEEGIVQMYEYFFRRRYKSYKYQFDIKKNKVLIEEFLERIHKAYDIHSVGYDWLFNYIAFQYSIFDHFEKKERKNVSDKILPSSILGKKGWERWQSRNTEFDFQILNSSFPQKYNISKQAILSKLEPQDENDFDPDKAMRSRYLNTEKGFAVCIEYTTLYNPKDTSCILCNNKSTCMQLLKANLPQLYTQRIKS